jgi:hypothetical protein
VVVEPNFGVVKAVPTGYGADLNGVILHEGVGVRLNLSNHL